MKRFLCLLFVFLFLASVSFAESDRVSVAGQYSLFINARAASGKGNNYDFDSYCIDLYLLEGNKSAYVNVVKCFAGIFTSSGTLPLTVTESDGTWYFVYANGTSFSGFFDDSGDLWLNLDLGTMRLHAVPFYSPLSDWME